MAIAGVTGCGTIIAEPGISEPGADGGAEGAAPGGSFCAPYPDAVSCVDFESGQLGTWQVIDDDGRNSVAPAEVDGAPSSPRALRLTIEPGASDDTDAMIELRYPAERAVYAFEARIRLEIVGPVPVRVLRFRVEPSDRFLRLATNGAIDGSLVSGTGSLPPLPVGQWARLLLTLDPNSLQASVSIDDGPPATLALDPTFATETAHQIRFGLFDVPPDARWVASIDNVLVTKQ